MNGLFAGSFSPPTNGHIDIILRSAPMFETLYVAVMANPDKTYLFSPSERIDMLQECVGTLPNVRLIQGSGLTSILAQKLGCHMLVRGVRDSSDYDYEKKMADMNFALCGVDTLLLPARQSLSQVSSSLVLEIAQLGGDVSKFVPETVLNHIQTALKKEC
ncbi:MAG: pantetheine-phosphate adenylyltransferase [Clostridiales bacterium]|nr:pantetheine-phosphate adenylyltransferase [Clostridiales bacterium]